MPHTTFNLLLTLTMWGYPLALTLYLVLRRLVGDATPLMALLSNFTPYYFLPLLVSTPVALLLRLLPLTALQILLIAVGATWLLPRYVRQTPCPSNGQPTLKIVTYNSASLMRSYPIVENWLRQVQPDIVLMQETFPPEIPEVYISRLKDLYPHQHHAVIKFYKGSILSRYPITPTDNERVVVHVNGQDIALYNVHLWQPSRNRLRLRIPRRLFFIKNILTYDPQRRDEQIDTLLNRIEDESLPYIVAGDFNMSDNTVMYDQLSTVLNDSFREAGIGMGTTWPHARATMLPEFVPSFLRIDYIWHSDHFTAIDAQTGPPLGSDHLPVVATLALNTKKQGKTDSPVTNL